MFSALTVSAQDWSTDTYQYSELYEGYVITAEGVKIEGFIKYRNRYVMQEEVIMYKSKEDVRSKTKYEAADLAEYHVGDKTYHCINYSGGAGIDIRANLLISDDGCIKEYVWYDRASGYNKLIQRQGESDEDFGARKYPPTTVFYKSGDGMGVTADFFKNDFSKKMASYVSDNKVLAKKIKKGENGYTKLLNMRAIFAEYNKYCQ